MLPRCCCSARSVRHPRAVKTALLSLSRVVIYLVLLCVSAASLQAQTLPEGYELHPLGGGLNGRAAAVHAAGDDIYYGGDFTQAYNALANGTPSQPVSHTNRIARWDGSAWHALGRGANGAVRAIARAADGSVYVGGFFTSVTQADGTVLPISYIARFKSGQWSAVGGGVDGGVVALAVVEQEDDGHELYVGGELKQATDSSGTQTVNHLVKWDGTQWQALGAGVNEVVLSIVYSKARGGLYVGGFFSYTHPLGAEPAVALSRAGFWQIEQQQWQAMGTYTTRTASDGVANFQETANGQSVWVSGDEGLKRFDWSASSWEQLSAANTFGMQLLPDQQRLISLSIQAHTGLQLWDLSAASPAPQTLAHFYSTYILQTAASHRSGVYLGFSNTVNSYHYAARLVLPDMDGDGVANADDSCPLVVNADQTDTDGDGYGDVCDVFPADPAEWLDSDGDGIGDNGDNCPLAPNVDQADQDQDGVGDVCDDDRDGDGVANAADNCPLVANADQTDTDGDGYGDVCDVFPTDPTEWLDSDGDGVGDNRDQFPDDPSRWFEGELSERTGDAAKQNFGQVLANVGDINGDFVDDYAIGTPNFKAPITVNGKTKWLNKAGKVELFSGLSGERLWQKIGSEKNALLGSAIASADFNDDGLLDIAIGSPGANKKRGAVQLCLAQGVVDGELQCRDRTLQGSSANGALFGSALAAQTGTAGGADLFVGAPKDMRADRIQPPRGNLWQLWQYSLRGNKRTGAVYQYQGSALGGTQNQIGYYDYLFGAAVNGEFGAALAWLPQAQTLAIGAPKTAQAGAVLLWQLADNQFRLLGGSAAKEGFGRKLAVGALADGVEHLAVSAPLAANGKLKQAGRVTVYDLAASSEPVQTYLGLSKGEQLGGSLAMDDKFNLFAGSPAYTAPKTASSKAIKKAGKVSRFILAADVVQDEKVGTQANQQFGASLAAIELTGDFKLDLLVGSTGANDPANKKLKAAGKLELINANDWQP